MEALLNCGVDFCLGATQQLVQMNPRTLSFSGAELLKDVAVRELLEAGIYMNPIDPGAFWFRTVEGGCCKGAARSLLK